MLIAEGGQVGRERRSLQDLIRSRQQSGFVGRQRQVVQYQENLGFPVDDERRRFLFNIHGDAGVGKTYLTKQLRQIAIDNGSLTAYIDQTVDDAISAMTVIAEEFSRDGVRFGEFEKRAAAYRERRHELEADPHAPDGVAAFLTRTAVTIGLAAARDVPIAGSLLAPVDAAAAADQVNRARTYLARKLSDHADVRLLLSPADELTPVFVSGMDRAAAGRPIALFIDTYERTGPLLDRWLYHLYAGQYGDLPESLVTTISGQHPLDLNLWGDYLPVIADVPLEPFSEDEARQFLANKSIHDESTTQVILTLSGRLPMWLATLAEARPIDVADIGDPAGDAVERFLKWEDDPARRSIAMTAALPRTINQDVLGTIAPSDKARELFGWLCGLPFVTRRAGSWAYHEVVRAAMLRLQLAQAPSEWRSSHVTLAQANGRWASNAAGGTGNSWKNPSWIDYTREQIYHLLCADPINNLPTALMSAVKAAECSAIRARQWAEVITDAGNDAINETLLKWGRRLSDGIHDSDLIQYLTCIINDAHLDKSTLAIALKERGQDHRLAKHYNEALADYNRAIELDPGNAWVIIGRGVTYQLTERYGEALADYNRAIELDPGNAWAIIGRGVTYQLTERYGEALADYNRGIELDPGSAWAIVGRGEAYRLMRRYDEALADYNRGIELDPGNAWAIVGRGEAYRLMGRYGEALADYNRGIELDPGSAWAIVGRGAAYRLMGRYGEALADYNRGIELDPGSAWAIGHRGETYRLMGRYDEALADYNRAIELDPVSAWAIADRGMTYGLMGRYDEALADYNRAIELDPIHARNIGNRGVTYQLMGRYGEALADYNCAIELDPGSAWAIAGRGMTYRLLGQYDEALTDLTRGLELDPGNVWAIIGRGEICHHIGRHDEALADYNRAIDFDPGNVWAIICRGETYQQIGQHEKALAEYKRGLELDPDNVRAIIGRGETYQKVGRPHEALTDLAGAIDLDRGYAGTVVGRGEGYQKMGRPHEALTDLAGAIDLDPGSARAILGRGKTYRQMERHEALSDYDHPVEPQPSLPFPLFYRGETTRLMERYDEALTGYARTIEPDPSHGAPRNREFASGGRRRRSRRPPTEAS
jgi:tetratricopeptide (TPR) repeat protein